MEQFSHELEGQESFYKKYLKRIDKELELDEILTDNTDGVLNGNIIEFKLYINNLSSVLFQTIKYLSSMRLKGKSIPKNIVLISLNNSVAYIYDSSHYLEHIEKIYFKSASKSNDGFIAYEPIKTLNYYENVLDEEILIQILKEKNYTKINIDENCIVGWAERYYRENPKANKSDFLGDKTGKIKILGEIRKPNKFKEFIFPYEKEDNIKFQYLMDKLNDRMNKKKLGAFYTPKLYVEKSLELVREAIKNVPKGNDYIILDRCAGTGNLEKLMTDEEISHCVVSTIEYYEYKVLLELLGDKVRHIVPPTEKEDTFNMGLVRGADALSKEYVENPIIKQYIDNPKCTIILFENPPYAETTSVEFQKKKKNKKASDWKDTYIFKKMDMDKDVKKSSKNELSTCFIWSAFKYYLRQPTDQYILYAPIKYWKTQNLVNKKFGGGYGFNRKYFHTNTDAFVSCIRWINEDVNNQNEFNLECYNIVNEELQNDGLLSIKKCYNRFSKMYDKAKYNDELGITCELNGKERTENLDKVRVKAKYNDNIIAYMVTMQFGFDNPDLNSGLTTLGRYDGNGGYLRLQNALQLLPLFSATRYIKYDKSYKIRTQLCKTSDMKDLYFRDFKNGKLDEFLLKNLIFVAVEPQNHCRSFYGSDGRLYKNELCLDKSLGETFITEKLKTYKLNKKEEKIINLFYEILNEAKTKKEYNPKLNYGLYQIDDEINTKKEELDNKKNKNDEYNYPKLNGNIDSLKKLIKDYYLEEIAPTLFKYELLK